MTNEDILKALDGLDKPDYDVHVIDNAWYSVRAMTAALARQPRAKLFLWNTLRIIIHCVYSHTT